VERGLGESLCDIRRLHPINMRVVPVILGVCVSLGGYYALSALDPDRYPATVAHLAETPEAQIGLYREALRRDPGSPYRWADLADVVFLSGDAAQARDLYGRAIRLAPGIPQIAVRAANFHFLDGEPEKGLRESARALRMVEAFDSVLFRSFDRLAGDAAAVLKEIGSDERSSQAYTRHLIAARQLDQAAVAWKWCRDHGFADDRMTSSYVDTLLREKQYTEASRAWVSYLGAKRGDYPSPNLIYNGSFEKELSGAALDWRIVPSQKFETSQDGSVARDGKVSLRIQFQGDENVSYSNVVQAVVVSPGKYRFQAWVKVSAITTNEGPQFQIYDPQSPGRMDVRVGPFVGSSEWIRVEQGISVGPDTHLVILRVLRQPSLKFDNKVSGTVWIDGVSLARQ
jgi:hypothetical protein